jgi:hypothetical protein
MAGEAFGRFGLGIGDPLAEDEDAHSPFTAFLHVGRCRAMAGFTLLLIGRAIGDGFLGVSRDLIGLKVILMAALTDFCPHRAIARPYLR